jgi:hypothetical protein
MERRLLKRVISLAITVATFSGAMQRAISSAPRPFKVLTVVRVSNRIRYTRNQKDKSSAGSAIQI